MKQAVSSEVPVRISDFVARWAGSDPEHPALIRGKTILTYAELNEAVDALALALITAGVGKGDRVATLDTTRPEFVVAWLATTSIGAIWVGLNPRYQLGELDYVLRDAEPKVLLTRSYIGDRDYSPHIVGLRQASPTLERVVVFDGDPQVPTTETLSAFLSAADVCPDRLHSAREAVAGRDPCTIVYTSGSTGAPKGALLHHHGIARFAIEQNRLWPVKPHSNLNFLPINHIGCLCDVTMPCLAAGGTLHFMEQFDPNAATKLIDEARLTIWGSVPSVLGMQMSTEAYRGLDGSSLQLIVWEGAAMPRDGIEALLRHGVPMTTNYSMTESVSSITALAPTRNLDLLANTVGDAFADVEIRLLDANGREVPDGEPGEVTIRSPYQFAGYWRRPVETRASLTPDGFFKTGDLAERRSDGRYRIVGRLKEMYKSGGYNVYPREIELALEQHPAVSMAAVVAVPDPKWQEVGVAFVQGTADLAVDALRTWCADRLANYKIPKRFAIVEQLPLLPIGKVDKVTLRRRAADEAARVEIGCDVEASR